jgi:hypothetical protein
VLGLQVGQRLTIINNDATYHITHTFAKKNRDWIQSQSPGAPPLKKTFEQPEFIPLKDDQHPWQEGYLGVFAHPFFAISDESGDYKIEGLPPGRYTVVARHETLGEQTVEITLGADESREVGFTFDTEDH